MLSSIDDVEIQRRFTNHTPKNAAVSAALDETTRWMVGVGEFILATVPPGREQSLAFTHLEQTSMWMKAGIARNQDAFSDE